MIAWALTLHEAINRWVFETTEYEDLLLSKKDWEHLEQLWKLLDCITVHTQQLSISRCPTIPFVLPIYDSLERHLTAASVSSDLAMELCMAAGVGKMKLLKYKWNAVTNYNYILGTVLHPFIHTEWFHKAAPPHWDIAKDTLNKDEEVL
ncbi:hypothetical protein BDQ17DRAFT_1427448 [Cyathus striatus]|nr:hypothetical protein BDQ17DRAFT_1440212 [Cyathus striatus]KAF8999965.1 hypothetical protein BDQ17DRAFT_1427448 [Cyathus striatus]